MKPYLFETHAHTDEVSRCSHIPAKEMVRLYKEKGYCGMIVTDHINISTFKDLDLPTWEEKAEYFLRGYHAALEEAGPDFTVLLGAEFHFLENNDDYLVYGMTEELLYQGLDNDILSWGIKRFSPFCREHHLLLIQAHPFRNTMVINDPSIVDGIEIMNGHPRHDSRNFLAKAWAEHYGKLMTSGSDAHQLPDIGRGGIRIEKPRITMDEFIQEIRTGAELIIPADAGMNK